MDFIDFTPEEIFRKIKRGEISINGHDCNFFTPLYYFVYRNKINLVEKLIEMGADVNEGCHNQIPLHQAVVDNNYDIVKVLINAGADVNIQDNFGKTPLYYAFKNKNLKIFELLIQNGADPYIKDDIGITQLCGLSLATARLYLKQPSSDILKTPIENAKSAVIIDYNGIGDMYISYVHWKIFTKSDKNLWKCENFTYEEGWAMRQFENKTYTTCEIAEEINERITKELVDCGIFDEYIISSEELYSEIIGGDLD